MRCSKRGSFDRFNKVFLHEYTEIKDRVVPESSKDTFCSVPLCRRKPDLSVRYVGDIANKRSKQVTRFNRHGTLYSPAEPKKKKTVRRVKTRNASLSQTDKSLNDRVTLKSETLRSSLNRTIEPPAKEPRRSESISLHSIYSAS